MSTRVVAVLACVASSLASCVDHRGCRGTPPASDHGCPTDDGSGHWADVAAPLTARYELSADQVERLIRRAYDPTSVEFAAVRFGAREARITPRRIAEVRWGHSPDCPECAVVAVAFDVETAADVASAAAGEGRVLMQVPLAVEGHGAAVSLTAGFAAATVVDVQVQLRDVAPGERDKLGEALGHHVLAQWRRSGRRVKLLCVHPPRPATGDGTDEGDEDVLDAGEDPGAVGLAASAETLAIVMSRADPT